jgi:hypothetical protein
MMVMMMMIMILMVMIQATTSNILGHPPTNHRGCWRAKRQPRNWLRQSTVHRWKAHLVLPGQQIDWENIIVMIS